MPFYCINHRNLNGVTSPIDSQEFADIEAVRKDCLSSAKRVIAEWLTCGGPLSEVLNESFEVTDTSGDTVLTVPFTEALEADTRLKLGTAI